MSQKAAQQVNGRERETATLLFGSSVKLGVACWRFRATSSPPLCVKQQTATLESEESGMDGKCLCGAIIVRTPDKKSIDACHCGMCRRWGGGPALGVSCGSDVQIDGIDKLKVYKSSEWAERAFCGECGTHMFYRLLAANEYFVPAGLFQNKIEFEFKEQIFIDMKPSYYEFANQTLNMTEAEVLAKFAKE